MHSSSSKRPVVFSSNASEIRRRSTFSAGIQRNLGLVARDQRDYVRAAEHFRESVRLARLTSG